MSQTQDQNPNFADDDEIDLVDLIRKLWLGKFWILGFASLAAVIGLVTAYDTPPTYRADALLQLEENRSQLVLPSDLSDLAGNDPRSVTEIEILRSRLVLGQAVATAHLDWQATPTKLPLVLNALARLGVPLPNIDNLSKYARGGESIRIDLLEVPPHWVAQPLLLELEEEGAYSLSLPNGNTLHGQSGEMLRDEDIGFALRVDELSGETGRIFTITQLPEASAIDDLRGRLSVSERGRQTGILELGLTGGDKQETERSLHAVTQAYLRQNVSRSAAEAESSLEFVEGQLPDAQAAVQKAETALNDYRQEQRAIDLGFEGQSLLTQIATLESELQKLADEEDQLKEKYTPSHPTYQQLLNTRSRLEERLAALRNEVGDLPQTQREVFNLTRDLELAQEVYVQLRNRAQELRVLRASTIGNVRIIDQARTAARPIAPRKSRILALHLLLGLIAGAGFVMLRNFLRKGVQSAEEIETLGLPVFATINHLPGAADHRTRKGHLPIHAIEQPDNLTIEGFRSLRTSLHFGLLDATSKSIAITSAAPMAGKSFTAINFATVAAQAGQTVCLIDADMRRGYLRRYFGVSKAQKGLSEYLSGQAELEDILVEGSIPGLFFISCGRYPPNPSELLMHSRFADLIATLNSGFDLSVFDSPPALAVTDSTVIARHVGATIAVVRFDETPLGEIEAIQRHFQNAGARLSGAILNDFDPRRAKSGSGYGYGYSYRYDYKSRDE